MGTKVYLSTAGAVVDREAATVSVFDRGFLYGDAVFETLRTAGGAPLDFAAHLTRLRRSAAAIGLTLPWDDSHLGRVVRETHAASENQDSYVRIIVTRGQGPLKLDPRVSERPALVVIVQPLALPDEDDYRRGVAAVIVHTTKGPAGLVDPSIKSSNYLANIQALRQAIARGADDAILCNAAGQVAEGATANVFAVLGERVVTPPVGGGLLPGITRQVVCELVGSLGLELTERALDPDELRRANEVFLTSSVRGVMPVTRLDGAPVGGGREGPITARIRRAYQERVAQLAGGSGSLGA